MTMFAFLWIWCGFAYSHTQLIRANWQCHPYRAYLTVCDSNGALCVYGKTYRENWSAFAPNFTELETNVEYEEREDEFDFVSQVPLLFGTLFVLLVRTYMFTC
jgi:hypothetical protein